MERSVGGLSVIFVLQNTFPVTVTFLGWDITASLALLLVLAMLVGVIISALLSLPGAVKSMFTVSGLKKENQVLTNKLQQAERDVSAMQPQTPASPPVTQRDV